MFSYIQINAHNSAMQYLIALASQEGTSLPLCKMNSDRWIHPDVDTVKELGEVADEEAAREVDAILSHEEHGGLDPKDYIHQSIIS